MSIGTKLKELREARGLSQNNLAELAGVKRGYISLLEIDAIKSPGAQPIMKLANALKVEEAVLLDEKEEVKGDNANKSFSSGGFKSSISPEFDDFVLYLQGQNPSPETLKQLRKIAEALLPEKPSRLKGSGE